MERRTEGGAVSLTDTNNPDGPGYDWTLHVEANGHQQTIWLGPDAEACERILEVPLRKYLRAIANELDTIEWAVCRQRIAEDVACALTGDNDPERAARILSSTPLGTTRKRRQRNTRWQAQRSARTYNRWGAWA